MDIVKNNPATSLSLFVSLILIIVGLSIKNNGATVGGILLGMITVYVKFAITHPHYAIWHLFF